MMDDETFADAHQGQTKESIGSCSPRDPQYTEWYEKEKGPEELIDEITSSKANVPDASVYVSLAGSRLTPTCAKHANHFREAQQRSINDNHNTRGVVNEGESNEMARSFEKRSAYFLRRANEWWNSLVDKRSQQKSDSGMKAQPSGQQGNATPSSPNAHPADTTSSFDFLEDNESPGTPTEDTTDKFGSSAWDD
jgi:hypothetical protein